MKNNTLIKQFRIVAILEGFSWIALLITMILKYKFEISFPNKIVGLIHGLFFLLFCGYILLFLIKEKWAFSKALILFIAAFLPFGTFWAAKKYLKK
jgi:integral membrane protein